LGGIVRPRFIAPGDDARADREELIAALRRFDATIQTVLRQLPSITEHLRTALRIFEEFLDKTQATAFELPGCNRQARPRTSGPGHARAEKWPPDWTFSYDRGAV